MPNTNRRSLLKTLAGLAAATPAAAAVVTTESAPAGSLRGKAGELISKARRKPARVTQAELQQALDFYNAAEIAFADIHRRIRAGAEMERGRLGVSTIGLSSLEWHEENGGIGECDNLQLSGIAIEPVEGLSRELEWLKENKLDNEIVLV